MIENKWEKMEKCAASIVLNILSIHTTNIRNFFDSISEKKFFVHKKSLIVKFQNIMIVPLVDICKV